MNKWIIALIGAVIVIGGGVAFVIMRGNDDNSAKVTNTSTGQSQADAVKTI